MICAGVNLWWAVGVLWCGGVAGRCDDSEQFWDDSGQSVGR